VDASAPRAGAQGDCGDKPVFIDKPIGGVVGADAVEIFRLAKEQACAGLHGIAYRYYDSMVELKKGECG